MSYILDALRKSDQQRQRQRGAMPTLLSADIVAAEPRPSEHWIYALIAAALVGVGIAIGWLQPWQSEPTHGAAVALGVVAGKSLDPGLRPSAAAPASPAPAAASPQASPSQERRSRKPQAKPAAAPVSAAAPRDRAVTAGARGTPEESAQLGPTPSAREPRTMSVGELPASIRQELPAMQISLHLYSTRPGNSFVSINNQMLQEGATAAPGLVLEQITPEGMVFRYKGYRFRRGVQ